MSPIKNVLLCPKHSNSVKHNIVSSFFFLFLQTSLLIFVSDMPELATAVLFFLYPQVMHSDTEITLLEARLWLKSNRGGWAVDKHQQSGWRYLKTIHDGELGWM